MRDGVPFEQDTKFCYYCQSHHLGDHAKFAMPATDRAWRKHWPDTALEQVVMQAREEEERLLAEEGVGG